MSVSGIGSSVSSDVFGVARQQERQSFRSLISSVRSGDLAGAQQALATLQQRGGAQPSAAQGGTSSARQNAFAALTAAVASGDVGAAQTALTSWQSTAPTRSHGSSSSNAGRDQFTSDFAGILQAVQAGNIGNAQQALATLQKDAPPLYSPASAPAAPAASSSNSSSSASPLSADVQALFSAIQSGDAAGAKTALDKLKTDAAAAQPAHHGHHHHHGAAVAPAVTTGIDATTGTAATTGNGATDVPLVATTTGSVTDVTGTG